MGKRDIERSLERYAKLRGESIHDAMKKTKFPKNVILFIGDGLSISTVTAARILKGQKYKKVSGEEQYLTFEKFPESAFLKVTDMRYFSHILVQKMNNYYQIMRKMTNMKAISHQLPVFSKARVCLHSFFLCTSMT